jgi:hypothetical protein
VCVCVCGGCVRNPGHGQAWWVRPAREQAGSPSHATNAPMHMHASTRRGSRIHYQTPSTHVLVTQGEVVHGDVGRELEAGEGRGAEGAAAVALHAPVGTGGWVRGALMCGGWGMSAAVLLPCHAIQAPVRICVCVEGPVIQALDLLVQHVPAAALRPHPALHLPCTTIIMPPCTFSHVSYAHV